MWKEDYFTPEPWCKCVIDQKNNGSVHTALLSIWSNSATTHFLCKWRFYIVRIACVKRIAVFRNAIVAILVLAVLETSLCKKLIYRIVLKFMPTHDWERWLEACLASDTNLRTNMFCRAAMILVKFRNCMQHFFLWYVSTRYTSFLVNQSFIWNWSEDT